MRVLYLLTGVVPGKGSLNSCCCCCGCCCCCNNISVVCICLDTVINVILDTALAYLVNFVLVNVQLDGFISV